jgi:hypothetical protein
MKKVKHNGFVLILVIALIAVIGLEMFVLADGSNTMLFQSDAAYLQACERNLVASGLAWAKRNIKDESKIFGKTIELDITNMNIRSSTLSVTISAPADKEKEIQVNVSCSRAKQTRSSTNKFKIGL